MNPFLHGRIPSPAGRVNPQVEQGTPAALARINTYELIRAVDGEPVGSVEAFEKLITAAQQQNKESVRLTVEWMGKTRLADLKFEAAASRSAIFVCHRPLTRRPRARRGRGRSGRRFA